MNEFDMVLNAMQKLNANANPVYAKRIGREIGLSGRETGYLLRRMKREKLVKIVDLSAKKWRL